MFQYFSLHHLNQLTELTQQTSTEMLLTWLDLQLAKTKHNRQTMKWSSVNPFQQTSEIQNSCQNIQSCCFFYRHFFSLQTCRNRKSEVKWLSPIKCKSQWAAHATEIVLSNSSKWNAAIFSVFNYNRAFPVLISRRVCYEKKRKEEKDACYCPTIREYHCSKYLI